MKKYMTMLLAFSLLLGCAGCGTSGASAETPVSSVDEVSEMPSVEVPSSDEETNPGSSETVDMLYYLNLGGGSIMAACYTEEDIAVMGQDYYVVHVGDAEIYNASGEKITLDELTRGCPVRISWPGMIMESYPGQIAAEKVQAISDTPDPSVPEEDEIPAVNGGYKWWEPELQRELPGLTMEYTTPDYVVAMFLNGLGSWSYVDEGETTEVISCGEDPLDWEYDDNNTCMWNHFDTIRFSCGIPWETISVNAYVDGKEETVEVPVNEDGTVELVNGGSVIYVVTCTWNTDTYKGEGTYAVKILIPSEC